MSIRVLYISSIPITNTTGGPALIYNHLINNNFEVYELNDSILNKPFSKYKTLQKLERRIQNSRFHYWIETVRKLTVRRLLKKNEIKTIRDFNPDVLMTVAHGELFWLAISVSKELKIPLVSFFHDWWPSIFDPEKKFPLFFKKIVERRFKSLHQTSHCSLCITEGMQVELGPNNRTEIIYPCTNIASIGETIINQTNNKFDIIYGGNIMQNYGKLMRQLILEKPDNEDLNFEIYGDSWDWDKEDSKNAFNMGVLRQSLPQSKFLNRITTASVLLVVQDFEPEMAKWSSTLFPSKIATYSKIGKPIVFWGPSYSTGAIFLNKHDAGIVIDVEDPKLVWGKIIELKKSSALQKYYSEKSSIVYQNILNPEAIQQKFIKVISEVIEK